MASGEIRPWREAGDAGQELHGPLMIWFGGVILPVAVALYGLACILAQEGILPTPSGPIMFQEMNAVLFGVAAISLAGLLHVQCYWDSRRGSTREGARRKFLFMLVMGVCAYALCLRMLHWI